jgi:hypothetical protein
MHVSRSGRLMYYESENLLCACPCSSFDENAIFVDTIYCKRPTYVIDVIRKVIRTALSFALVTILLYYNFPLFYSLCSLTYWLQFKGSYRTR